MDLTVRSAGGRVRPSTSRPARHALCAAVVALLACDRIDTQSLKKQLSDQVQARVPARAELPAHPTRTPAADLHRKSTSYRACLDAFDHALAIRHEDDGTHPDPARTASCLRAQSFGARLNPQRPELDARLAEYLGAARATPLDEQQYADARDALDAEVLDLELESLRAQMAATGGEPDPIVAVRAELRAFELCVRFGESRCEEEHDAAKLAVEHATALLSTGGIWAAPLSDALAESLARMAAVRRLGRAGRGGRRAADVRRARTHLDQAVHRYQAGLLAPESEAATESSSSATGGATPS